MSDIFREVEEDVRRERLEKIWKQYGDFIIAAVAIVVIAAAGMQVWKYYQAGQRARASEALLSAQTMMDSGQTDKANEALAKLIDNGPSGYRELAKMERAGALLAAGKRNDAIALYKDVVADKDPLLSDVARLRIAWASADFMPRKDLQTLLAPLTDPNSAWRAMAEEVLAYASYRAGDTAAALRGFKTLSAYQDAPATLRGRAGAMVQFLEAGGEQNYGTVPEPEAPKAATPDNAAPQPNATHP